MESFPIPGPEEPTLDQANQDLAEQQSIVDALLGEFAGLVGMGLAEQSAQVGKLEAKLNAALGVALNMQQAIVQEQVVNLQVGLAAQTQEQQSHVNAIVGSVLPIIGGAVRLGTPGVMPGVAAPPTISARPPLTGAQPSLPQSVGATSAGPTSTAPPGARQPPYSQSDHVESSHATAAISGAPIGSSDVLSLTRSAPPPVSAPTGMGAPVSEFLPGPVAPTALPPGFTPPPTPAAVVPGAGCPAPIMACPAPVVNVYVPPYPAAPATTPAPTPPRTIDVAGEDEERPARPPAGPFATAVCDSLAPLMAGLPDVGSAEWCAGMESLLEQLDKLGSGLLDALCGAVDKVWPAIQQISNVFSEAALKAPAPLVPVFVALQDFFSDVASWVRQGVLICDCLKAVAALKGSCQPSRLVGLAVVRGVVTAIRAVQIGVEVPIRLTTGIGVILPQVETVLQYLTDYACPYEIPSIGETMEAYLQSEISRDIYTCWMMCRGASPTTWNPILRTKAGRIHDHQWIEYGRRLGWTAEQVNDRLISEGWIKEDDRTALETLYDQLPTLGEITSWARAGALDDRIALKWGTDTFSAAIWASPYGQALRAKGVTQSTFTSAWRAHWRMPGLAEAREWLWRLRPGRAGVAVGFSEADYRALIDAEPTVPAVKDLLFETRYRELSPGEVQSMVARGVRGLGSLRDSYLTAGYAPGDVDSLMRLADERTQQALDGALYGYTPRSVASYVRLGIMTSANAHFWFARWGYTSGQADQAVAGSINGYEAKLRQQFNRMAQRKLLSQVLKAYEVGTMSHDSAQKALTSVGMQTQTASVLLQTTDAAFQQTLASGAITRVKGALLKGQITRAQAVAALHTAQIVEPRASQYVASWESELTLHVRTMTASEILRYFTEGLMTYAQAEQRLTTLGYQKPDVTLKLADANRKILVRRVKAEQSIVWPSSSATGTLAGLASEAATQAAELLKSAEKDAPVQELRKLYEGGAITPEFVVDSLVSYGYSPNAAATTVTTWAVGGIGASEKTDEGKVGPVGVGVAGKR